MSALWLPSQLQLAKRIQSIGHDFNFDFKASEIYFTEYYSQTPRSLGSSKIMPLMQKGNLDQGNGNLVMDSLVVCGHGSLLERLSKRRVGVTCSCNIYQRG